MGVGNPDHSSGDGPGIILVFMVVVLLLGSLVLKVASDDEHYVPIPITDPETVSLMAKYGLSNPHYDLRVPDCRFMDGRRDAFTAKTLEGQTVEGSICAGSDFGRGPRIELR